MDTDNERGEPRLATFSERALAISVDYAIFAAGYWLTQRAFFPDPILAVRNTGLWLMIWAALFVLYQAYSSSEGRSSLGKSLLGLKVVTLEREPLGVGQALIRSALYLPSSFMGLGFLWSFLGNSRQCWHDMAAGSVVVCERPRQSEPMLWVRAGAAACVALFALGFMWERVWEPRYNRVKVVAYAYMGLKEMASLQQDHLKQKGRYAENVFELASLSVDPKSFLTDMAVYFDADSGININANRHGYTISARARDTRRTPVTIRGS